jgi:hypothetical protein
MIMSATVAASLEDVIRQSNEDWLIDWFEPPTEALGFLRRALAEADQRARARWGEEAPALTEQSLVVEHARNPLRVKCFLQVLGARCTPEILVMAWRVLQGLNIQSVEVDYQRGSSFRVRVVLATSHGSEDEPYLTSDPNDFKVFRHVGIMKVGSQSVLDGLYPLRTG